MKLIVGLGNPGLRYARNRHNIGFMCVNYFARKHNIKFDQKQGKARIGIGEVAGETVVVARPQTFMNASGESVSLLVNRFKVSLDDLIVVHDDLDLPLGKIRVRKGSSAGGHKGASSIISYLGSQDFIRIRIGIGRPCQTECIFDGDAEVIDHVLSDFTREETKVIDETIQKVSEAILCLITEGLTAAMNKYN